MVAKCTNPHCFAPFRRLDRGTLFRLETDPGIGASKHRAPEYFWLCDSCSAVMTLILSDDGTLETCAFSVAGAHRAGSEFPAVSRCHGLWLYSVSLLRGQRTGDAA